MRIRFGLLTAAAWVTMTAAAAAQSAPGPAANEDCLACHGESDAQRITASVHAPVACVDCHADLASVKEFPHAEKLQKVACASCHDTVAAKYRDSIHSWAIEKAGLIVAPSCADCHGKHDITGPATASSRVARIAVPATCGSCHAGVTQQYDRGSHGAAMKNGDSRAPSCIDCHTAHTIKRADTDAWRLSVTAECGTCHVSVVDSFTRTFHGKVTQMGYTRVAACADCHGPHEVLPASNPASPIASRNLVSTCGKCHQGANESFVKYDPHPDPNNYSRSAVLWWANRFYWVLIPGCFGFFGLHSALWYRRSRKHGGER